MKLVASLLSLLVREKATPGFFRDCTATTVDLLPGLCTSGCNGDLSKHLPDHLPKHLATHLPRGVIRLGSDARLLWCSSSAPDFAMSRTAVFAHWSEQGTVAPYVLVFLRALKAAGWRLVLTCGREPVVTPVLTRLCDAIVCRDCAGYDFTSWKAALEVCPSLFAASELLFTNDSIFAPIGDLSPIHRAMRAVPCDFWGLVASRERLPHLQSYYLVFRAATLKHPAFAAFWNAVDRTADRLEAVLRYEVILSPWLALHGLTPGAYVPFQALPDTNINPAHYFWKELLSRYGVPVLKRDLLRDYRDTPFLSGWETLLERQGYNPALVQQFFAPPQQ
ncbi:MAG: rhamnan synthesis F family protein [Bilophila sp.]